MDAGGANKVTIDQVAQRCGVSKTTVSRYLNRKYENISPETRERIAQVIRELGYRPNRSAQRLKAARTMLIGCSIGDVSSPFAGLLLKGSTGVCEAAGYQVLFADCGEDPAKERLALEGFLENRVDGLIVNTPGGNDAFLAQLRARGVPIVLADRGMADSCGIDAAISEYDRSIRECMRLLLDCGYAHIAFFTETVGNIMPRIQRRESYQAALRDLTGGRMQSEIFEFDPAEEGACLSCARAFLAAHPGKRVAVLSVNGVTARHLLVALQALDIRTGYDFGLCTFDDWTWFKLVPPGITAVQQQTEALGAAAAQLLLKRISGETPEGAPASVLELPTTLCVRGSTVKERG